MFGIMTMQILAQMKLIFDPVDLTKIMGESAIRLAAISDDPYDKPSDFLQMAADHFRSQGR